MLRALAFCCASLLLVACGARAEGFEPLQRPSGEYADLGSLAEKWRTAVANRQTDDVVGYALPEAREVVRRDLGDPASPLYEALYGTRTHDLLQNPGLRMLLIPHKDLVQHGMGTTVCFLDPSQQEPPWPVSREGLNALSRQSGALCIFMFRADQRWYSSYEFAYPEDGA